MATLQTVTTTARLIGQTDAGGLTDTLALEYANTAIVDFHRELITAGVDAVGVQEAYRDLTAGTGTYLYPSDMFFAKAVSFNLNGSTSNPNYVTPTQVDVSNLPGNKSFEWMRVNIPSDKPYIDDHGDWFEVFPTPQTGMNLTQAFRLFYFLQPTQYTALTDTITYVESLDYRILSYKMLELYVGQYLRQPKKAEPYGIEYNKRMKQLINTLSRGSQMPTQTQGLPLTGAEF